MGNVVIGGTATGATALPTYPTTVDRANDLLAIYSNANAGTYSISPNSMLGITGAPVGTTDTQTISAKTINSSTISNSNTVTLKDGTSFKLQNTSDTTKQAEFSLASITTGTTRTYTLPDASDTLVTLAATQTLTAKTLTSPTINTPTISGGTQSSPAITTPKIITSLNDANGNAWIKQTATASAVNEVTITNAATGNAPDIAPTGGDTNISLTITPKGTGLFKLPAGKTAGLVRQRQGGTSGDGAWNTAGTTNTDTSAKSVFIQVGTATSSVTSAVTVTFPVAFTQAPIVILTPISASNGFFAEVDTAATTTQFTMTCWSATASLAAKTVQWIAIGQ